MCMGQPADSPDLVDRLLHLVSRTAHTVWRNLSWVLEEFEPWLKWIIFDAVMTLIIRGVSNRWKQSVPYLEAIGWL